MMQSRICFVFCSDDFAMFFASAVSAPIAFCKAAHPEGKVR